jgi:Zn-dependent protease
MPGRKRQTAGVLSRGILLGRIASIEVVIDFSLILVFLLVLGSLAFGVFPKWHPDWSFWMVGLVSVAAAVLFFGSVLAHELSHALTARSMGIEVKRITLFIFGGMAHMEDEARTPGAEFLVAIAGPLMSMIIGGLSLLAGGAFTAANLSGIAQSGQQALASLGPVATLLMWLGPVNLILAAFNLVPGFPLDGGRVLRALIWWVSGSLHTATRVAALGGQGFGWILMGAGILMVLGFHVPLFGEGLSGLWLILIGWFLNSAARMSYRQFEMLRLLESVPVSEVMRTSLSTLSPDDTLDEVVAEKVMNTDQRTFPVVAKEDDNALLGIVTLDTILRVSRDRWSETRVDALMTPDEDLVVMSPDQDADEALRRLANRNVEHIPVVAEGKLRGIIRRQDIMKWMALNPASDRG